MRACTVEPAAGDVIVEVGGVLSLDAVAGVSAPCSVAGCAPMSARRLTVACCRLTSGVVGPPSCVPSNAHAHCVVPDPNTSDEVLPLT